MCVNIEKRDIQIFIQLNTEFNRRPRRDKLFLI